MGYVLWALLTITISFAFLFVCFKAVKMVRREMGLAVAVFFVVGLLSFGSTADRAAETTLKTDVTPVDYKNHHVDLARDLLEIPLQKTPLSTLKLFVRYGTSENMQQIPVNAFVSWEGWQIGTQWTADVVMVQPVGDHEIAYTVNGRIGWELLGIRLWTHAKEWEGTVPLDGHAASAEK